MTYKLLYFCELDQNAVASYCAIHGLDPSLNLGDITKVEPTSLQDFNLLTWGFPCTDISLAGTRQGFQDNLGMRTKSGLYHEGIRILTAKRPEISIIENVANLAQSEFADIFTQILNDLSDLGYNNYWQVLNAKDYGIPQTRRRIFIVSIRSDVDTRLFQFPAPYDNGLRVEDFLTDTKDPKYLIDETHNKIAYNKLLKKGYTNTVQTGVAYPARNREYRDFKSYAPTLVARDGKDPKMAKIYDPVTQTTYFRKLTPLEYFKLMGYSEEDYLKASKASSATELYKQAGNSIVVNVLQHLLQELFLAQPVPEPLTVCSLFSGIGAFEKALTTLSKQNAK